MKEKHKKMIAPIVITIFIIVYYVVYFGILAALLGGVWKYFFAIIPIVFAAVIVKVCIERIKEIKRGEEDDLSQY